MKRVLISTVYNEAGSIDQWIDAIKAQTVKPDEFVIVDAESRDDTVQRLRQGFNTGDFPPPRIIVQRCNIAAGRNIAIQNSTLEVIASSDAGSIPDPHWLEEITRPFEIHPDVGVVGGVCPMNVTNDLQRTVARLTAGELTKHTEGDDCSPSSRNVAFTRKAWSMVGGYPEWLTLTAEDALYNVNLHAVGIRFYYQPTAIVSWDLRPDLRSYLKMMASYGFGSAEMDLAPHLYRRWLLTTVFPPLILFSPNRLSDIPFRYLRNAACTLGWLKGKIKGRRPPSDWKCINGAWLSPQSLASLEKR